MSLQARFVKASALAGEEFFGRLDYYAKAWLPARTLVADGLSRRAQVDLSGRIILFEQFAPWKVSLRSTLSGPTFCLPLFLLGNLIPTFLSPHPREV
jgi:hypothetical protein